MTSTEFGMTSSPLVNGTALGTHGADGRPILAGDVT